MQLSLPPTVYIYASEAFLFNATTKLKQKQTWMCHTDMQMSSILRQ